MSMPAPVTPTSAPASRPFCPVAILKPYLVPYYLMVAAVLGAITVAFVVVFILLGVVTGNFNFLGAVE